MSNNKLHSLYKWSTFFFSWVLLKIQKKYCDFHMYHVKLHKETLQIKVKLNFYKNVFHSVMWSFSFDIRFLDTLYLFIFSCVTFLFVSQYSEISEYTFRERYKYNKYVNKQKKNNKYKAFL